MSNTTKTKSAKTVSTKAAKAAGAGGVAPAQDKVYDAVSKAYDELEGLYNVSEGADSVQLFQALMELSRLRTALNQSNLKARTEEYKAIKQSLGPILEQLKKAKDRIDRIIKGATTAARVAGYLDKAMNLVAKYFA